MPRLLMPAITLFRFRLRHAFVDDRLDFFESARFQFSQFDADVGDENDGEDAGTAIVDYPGVRLQRFAGIDQPLQPVRLESPTLSTRESRFSAGKSSDTRGGIS